MSQDIPVNNFSILDCNRSLLNPLFEGYKLKLLESEGDDSIIRSSLRLPTSLDFQSLFSKHQEKRVTSYYETKARINFNHAQVKLKINNDKGVSDSVFFIDTEYNLVCVRLEEKESLLLSILDNLVYPSFSNSCLVLPTIKFINFCEIKQNGIFVVSLGEDVLQVFLFNAKTFQINSIRTLNLPKISEQSTTLENWTLLDVSKNQTSLNILALVTSPETNKKHSIVHCQFSNISSPLESYLEHFENDVSVVTILEGEEYPTYGFFRDDSSEFFIASKKPFKKVFDVSLPIEPPTCIQITSESSKSIPYAWLQTSEDVTVHFSFDSPIELKQLKCKLNDSTLSLSSLNLPTMERNWYDKIVSSDSFWTIEDKRWLTLNLEKHNKGTRWTHLFDIDDNVLEAMDPNELATIRENMEKYTSATESEVKERYPLQQPFGSELEPEDLEGDEVNLYLHSCHTGNITKVYLSSGMSWIGTVLPDSHQNSQEFIMHHDVDALIFGPSSNSEFRHIDTFDAMGYVQASKRNRKLLTLSPDHQLMMILEHSTQVFLYGRGQNSSTTSKPRHSPQAVITLPTTATLHGVQLVGNSDLLLLTSDEVILVNLESFL